MSAPLDIESLRRRVDYVTAKFDPHPAANPEWLVQGWHILSDEVPALLLALQEAQDALRAFVTQCAPDGTSHFPAAPSQRTYERGVAVLGDVDETTGD